VNGAKENVGAWHVGGCHPWNFIYISLFLIPKFAPTRLHVIVPSLVA